MAAELKPYYNQSEKPLSKLKKSQLNKNYSISQRKNAY